MNMQRNITGKKLRYRPLTEAEMSKQDLAKAYSGSDRQTRIARLLSGMLKEASSKQVELKPNDARWYCLLVEKGREETVEKMLEQAEVTRHVPREKVIFVRKGQKLEGVRVMYSGYVFVRIVPGDRAFDGLSRLAHVHGFLGSSSRRHIVSDGDILFSSSSYAQGDAPRVETDKTMKQGDMAEINGGPFNGFSCMLLDVRWSRTAHARVVITIGDRPFEIESMPLAFLKKL